MQVRMLRAIDELLGDVPQTRKTLELKEEMLQNLMEKYKDLVAAGKSEEDAFTIAIESVGDISDLVAELRGESGPSRRASRGLGEELPHPRAPVIEDPFDDDGDAPYDEPTEGPEEARGRRARVTSLAVMFFVLSPVPVLVFQSGMGVVLLFAMIAAGVALLVFSGMTARPAASAGGFDAADFARRPEETPPDRKKLMGSVSGAYWCLVTALYILISFSTGAWHISWVLFLIASSVWGLIRLWMNPAGVKPLSVLSSTLWTMTTAFYFIISFATGAWHISWIIFLIAAALNNVLRIYLREERRP